MIARILLVGLLSLSACFVASAQDETTTNLLKNAGFESPAISTGSESMATPDEWFHFSSTPEKKGGVSDARKRSGSQAMCFQAQEPSDAFQGLAYKFPALSGKGYTFSLYVISDPANPVSGSSFGQISIEWRDATGKEIARNFGPTWNFELSSTQWERFTVNADAPAGAVEGSAVITFFAKDCKGAGSFFVDDTDLSCKNN